MKGTEEDEEEGEGGDGERVRKAVKGRGEAGECLHISKLIPQKMYMEKKMKGRGGRRGEGRGKKKE